MATGDQLLTAQQSAMERAAATGYIENTSVPDGWGAKLGTPDLYSDGGTNDTTFLNATNGEDYFRLRELADANIFDEALGLSLTTPLQAGVTYTLTVDLAAYFGNSESGFGDHHGTTAQAGTSTFSLYTGSASSPTILADINVVNSPSDPGFNTYSVEFTPTANVTNIRISNKADTPSADIDDTIFVDNMFITEGSLAVCFARGMAIETDHGDVLVEDLAVGDLVRTYDNGFQTVKFVYGWQVPARGQNRPIVFKAGTIGNAKDVVVSQEHKILVDNVRSDLLPSALRREDHLIKASLLINGDEVYIDRSVDNVEYFHIMFDQHELIYCHGSISESWQPKVKNLRRSPELKAALLRQFPDFNRISGASRRPVRNEVCVVAHEGQNLSLRPIIAGTDKNRRACPICA